MLWKLRTAGESSEADMLWFGLAPGQETPGRAVLVTMASQIKQPYEMEK